MASDTLPGLEAIPTAGQHVQHGSKEYQTIKEGLAHILIPATASAAPKTHPRKENEPQAVFYNPIQQFNRDISVLAIKAYGEQVVARKIKNAQKFKSMRQEKKRKRHADNADGDGPRKTGRLESHHGVSIKVEASNEIRSTYEKTEIPESSVSTALPKSSLDNVAVGVAAGNESKTNEQSGRAQALPPSNTDQEGDGGGGEGRRKEANLDPLARGLSASESSSPRPAFTILDALSATGLRALRYAHELPFVTSVTANDLLPTAVKSINMNVQHNKLQDKIKTTTGNAMAHMYNLCGIDDKDHPSWSKKYDVIDLDPYGTAAPFIESAVQAVRDDGGLLCVTCTDAGVWASNAYPEKAYSLYGGTTLKGTHSHEGGLRLILHSIATSAARYGLAIEPLLSLSIDFYARVFVRVYRSPADVKFLAGKTIVVYNCDTGCGAWTTQTLARNKLAPNKSGKGHFWKHTYAQGPSASEHCPHCNAKTHIGGPMYAGPIHSAAFINQILEDLPKVSKDTYQTINRIEGMLTLALEEMLPDPEDPSSPTATTETGTYDPAIVDNYPFHFKPDMLSKVLRCITPHEDAFRGAIRHLGYRATRSHTKAGSIKTDAPWAVIWEIMREWVRQKAPVKKGALKPNTAGYRILRLQDENAENSTEEVPRTDTAIEPVTSDTSQTRGPNTEKPKLTVVFDEKLGREKEKKKLVRYQLNPRENWGPMQRAKGPA